MILILPLRFTPTFDRGGGPGARGLQPAEERAARIRACRAADTPPSRQAGIPAARSQSGYPRAFSGSSIAAANPFRFSSEYADDLLSLVYYNYRPYNPIDGRWTSRDPATAMNVYTLIDNKLFLLDLLGLRTCCSICVYSACEINAHDKTTPYSIDVMGHTWFTLKSTDEFDLDKKGLGPVFDPRTGRVVIRANPCDMCRQLQAQGGRAIFSRYNPCPLYLRIFFTPIVAPVPLRR